MTDVDGNLLEYFARENLKVRVFPWNLKQNYFFKYTNRLIIQARDTSTMAVD